MLLVVVAAFYFIFCGLLYVFQRSLLYHPSWRNEDADKRSIFFDSDGEKIRVITARSQNVSGKAIIYFGGNGDSASESCISLGSEFKDQDIFCLDYRGFGGSTGQPTEEGIFADSLVLYDLVSKDHADVAIIGRSLGSGVGVYVASQRPVNKLVLITPYDSITNVASFQFPIFPVSLMLKDRYDSASRVLEIKSPTLIFLAENDRTIPRSNSEELIRRFPSGQARVEILSGTTHNSIIVNDQMFRSIREFLA